MNTAGLFSEAFDEFLHGYKGACADEARQEQLKWPETLRQDKQLIWPSEVNLYPSLAVVEDSYLNVNLKHNLENSDSYKNNQTTHLQHPQTKSLNSSFGLSFNFEMPKVEAHDFLPLFTSSSKTDEKNDYNGCDNILNTLTTHDALKAISLTCVQDGEKIARIHRHRPFFKKMDGLCDRIKHDLIHHDTVIPHVRAQGLMWAIKDLIFVCTRIINGWHITKGYVYDPSEGLNKVRSTLTSKFVPSFLVWQESSLKFLKSLMLSFLSLDILVQTSRNSLQYFEFFTKLDVFMENLMNSGKGSCNSKLDSRYWEQCGCDPCKLIISSIATQNTMKQLGVVCCEYGEKVAKNYTCRPFFKKIDILCIRTKMELTNGDGALSNLNSQGTVWAIKELIFASTRIINAWNITKGYVYASSESLDRVRDGFSIDFMPCFITWQESTNTFIENLRLSFLSLHNLAHIESNNLKKESGCKPLYAFRAYLQELKSGEVFLRTIFCENYFPDFIAKNPDFRDIQSIIRKCHAGGYNHVFEIVHDVRLIIYQVKKYLMRNINPDLDKIVSNFEADINKILVTKPLKDFNFDHIEGRPTESLFLLQN